MYLPRLILPMLALGMAAPAAEPLKKTRTISLSADFFATVSETVKAARPNHPGVLCMSLHRARKISG